MSDEELNAFAEDLRQEVLTRAESEGAEALQSAAFTEVMIEYLTDAGEIDDGVPCFHQARGLAVSGYSVSADDEFLNLFVNIHTQAVPPPTISRADVETAFRRLSTYLERALTDYHLQLEEASEAFDMTQTVRALRGRLDRVRLFVITDGLTTASTASSRTVTHSSR